MLLVVNSQLQFNLAQKLIESSEIFISVLDSCFFGFFYTLLPIIGYWFLFEKKNEAGWKNLIPFYGSYMRYKLFFRTDKWWRRFFAIVLLFVTIMSAVISSAVINIVSGGNLICVYILVISFVAIVMIIIWIIVISIQYDISICKKYGFGGWFILGMIFMTPLFVGIIAYEVYRGRAKEVESIETDEKNVS